MRTIALCLVALALAFAPAPLPRRDRNKAEDDLARLQGSWGGVTHNGHLSRDFVVVKGDLWRANTPDDSWIIKLDQTKRPRQINLIHSKTKAEVFRGIYKFEGNQFTYSLGYNVKEEARPKDFEVRGGSWVSVFERKGP